MRYGPFHPGIVLLFAAILLVHCRTDERPGDNNASMIASVNGYQLHLSEVPRIHSGETPQDSIQWLKTFAERWAKNKVMLKSAEEHISNDAEVEELVRNYRNTLILHRYEKNLIESQIDSNVSQQELLEYYRDNKSQYVLESSILRCLFVKLGKPVKNLEEFRSWWESDAPQDRQELIDYCQSYANIYLLEDSSWYRSETIAQYLPEQYSDRPASEWPKEIVAEDESYLYFLRVLNTVPSKEIAPLTYIEEQARRVILHKRKLKLLDEAKNRLYEKALSENEVKILIE